MSEKLTLILANRQQAWADMQTRLHPFLKEMLQANKRLVLTVCEETRSLEQNRKCWAMLSEVSEQVNWHGQNLSAEDWKHVFTASLKKQRAVPGIDGGFVVLGQSTSKMTIAEMSELIELMHAFGAEHNVTFKDHG
jgi:hypothetical protein